MEVRFLKFHLLLIITCVLECSTVYSQKLKKTQSDSLWKINIENCVNSLDMQKIIPTKVGYQYWFVDKDFLDGRTLKLSVVSPKKSTHPPHSHSEDEIFFVLEGTAEFFLNGKTMVAGPNTSFYCPPNSEHGISNVGDTELKYLVIKKYEEQ